MFPPPKSSSPGYHGHVIILPCYKSPFRWYGDINSCLPCYETLFRWHGTIKTTFPCHETLFCWYKTIKTALPCYETPLWLHEGRALATVARTVSTMPGQAFGRIGGKGPAGPTRVAVLRSSRTASVRRRWTGQNALTKRRSSPSSNRVGQARPFPTSARRPVVAGQKVRGNKAQGL